MGNPNQPQAGFSFHLPTKIEFGDGRLAQVGSLTAELVAGRRAFIVTDPGLVRVGVTPAVERSLAAAGFTVERFDGVQPNPKDTDCEAGGEAARAFAAEVIVAVGGGSVLDSAKAIALLQTHGGRVRDYEGRGKVRREVTPIVAVPTTAGTGSEVTRSAVITDTARHFKMTVKDVRLAPRLAVVDPETTHALPVKLTASTGMDALVHAVEAYTCRAANPMSDELAAAAMKLIYPALRPAVRAAAGTGGAADGPGVDGESDRTARRDLMFGSLLAGLAFSHSDVGAVHCLAEAIGGLYDTPHGVANSMFFPVVTAFNAEVAPERHAQAAAACGLPVAGLPAAEAAALFVSELARLARDIGIPAFRASGADPADFERLAEASFQNGSTPDNCRPVTREDYLRLLRQAWDVPAGQA
ncbi:MAG: iron-containing alcohol dehydrogenase [Bacillota bacterium]